MGNSIIRRIGATVVAVLLLVYVAYQFYLARYTGVDTETAMYSTVSETIDTTAFIVRSEHLVKSGVKGVLNYTVDNGERTAAGGIIARAYPSEEDASARNRIDRIDDELTRLAVLENPGEIVTSNSKLIGGQVSDKIVSMLESMRKGSIDDVEQQKNDLQLLLSQKQIITGVESAEEYTKHLDALRAERNELLASSAAHTGIVKAPAAGYFIQSLDGYEDAVDIEYVSSLSVQDINALINEDRAKEQNGRVLGKIAKDFKWYVVCVIDENDYVRLDRTTDITLEMPFATAEKIPAKIIDINRDLETGEAALIIECLYMNADLASTRKEPLRINISEHSGVLVNEKAIHFNDVVVSETDADGNETETVYENVKGVYIKYGSRIRFVQVFSDATVNGYAICKTTLTTAEREQLVTGRTIEMYDEVVLGGTDLYDGKII
ncbi:MAG: hypothetical protein II230_08990 [Clostridia bacterium]|nr:hypothetical protein [Clostridia bacterium]